jgi:hypothetical protein
MDQTRAGQSLFLSRCLTRGDANVTLAIERIYRESTQRGIEFANETVAALEANLAMQVDLLRTKVQDEARLVLLLAEPQSTPEVLAQIRSQLEEVRDRSSRVRVLRMRTGKERKRAQKIEADARAGGYGAADATHIAFQLFEFGYFPDIWVGHEHLLPLGATPFVVV